MTNFVTGKVNKMEAQKEYRAYLTKDMPFETKDINTPILELVFDAMPRPTAELVSHYDMFGFGLYEAYKNVGITERTIERMKEKDRIFNLPPVPEDYIKNSEREPRFYVPKGDYELGIMMPTWTKRGE